MWVYPGLGGGLVGVAGIVLEVFGFAFVGLMLLRLLLVRLLAFKSSCVFVS